jgi:quinol-cytochrome oxidoreductase complex cytochrome b subunit
VAGALRRGLRRGFDYAERGLDAIFGPEWNPLGQLGALGWFLFWIVAATGIYLFIFFDTGVVNAYASIEWLSNDHWFHAGVTRSFHRYASDLLVAVMLLHLVREFAYDRYRGVRWFSWFTGVPLIWFVYISGITGYWLVWDMLAQYVAIVSTELLDWLPVFGEPIARNFLSPDSLGGRFFTLMVFLHIAIPLILLLGMWIHVLRISRARVNPSRELGGMVLAGLLVVSLVLPAMSQGPADLAKVPAEVGIDWFYLPLYPLIDSPAMAPTYARAARCGGLPRPLQRLCALCRGLPLFGNRSGAAHRRRAVCATGRGQHRPLRCLRYLHGRMPVLVAVPAPD